MDKTFNIITDNDNDNILINSKLNDVDNGFNIIRESSKTSSPKDSNFISPRLNTSDDTLGLNLLMNDKAKAFSDNESSVSENENKEHIFNSSSSEDDDDEEVNNIEDEQQHTTFKPSDYFGGNVYKSDEEILKEKTELLYQFDRLEKRGVKLPRRFTIDSSLDEMKSEYERLKRDKEVDASIAMQRKFLIAFSSGMEFLNNRFDPFGVNLSGWSETIHEGVEDYDDIFEELHYKYKRKSNMAPELKLLMSLGSSMFMHHLTTSMFKSSSLPGVEQIMKENPNLAKQFAGAAANSMKQNDKTGMAGMFANIFPQPADMNTNMNSQKATMSGPSDLNGILNDLGNNDRLESMSSVTQSELSEMTETNSIAKLISSGKRKSKKNVRTMNI
jgi:hypothetical protein